MTDRPGRDIGQKEQEDAEGKYRESQRNIPVSPVIGAFGRPQDIDLRFAVTSDPLNRNEINRYPREKEHDVQQWLHVVAHVSPLTPKVSTLNVTVA
jgi:hypothetical protein